MITPRNIQKISDEHSKINSGRKSLCFVKERFFSADTKNESFIQKSFMEILDEETDFNFSIFLEIAFYHFLFFAIFGPFTPLFMFLVFRNMILARNLGFIGISRNFFAQTLIYLINFVAIFGSLFLDSPYISKYEMIILIAGLLVRALIIAIKYALFGEKKIFLLKNTSLTKEEQESEHLIVWIEHKDEEIEKEITNTIMRINVDASVFKVFFIRKLGENQISEIQSHCKKSKHHGTTICNEMLSRINQNNETQIEKDENQAYWGHIIAKMLIKNSFKKNFLSKTYFKIAFLISFFHTLIPFVMRYYEHRRIFGKSSFENAVIVCLSISDLLFYFMNTVFLLAGIIAYGRKLKLLGHLSNLISPKKMEHPGSCKIKKIFPTLNFFNKISFKSWYILHALFRNYSNKIYKRVESQIGVFLIQFLIYSFLCLLTIFEVNTFLNKSDLILYSYEFCLMFIFLFNVIYQGISINSHYYIHENLLRENKDVFFDLINLDEIYFDENFVSSNEIYQLAKEMMQNSLPTDKINKKEFAENVPSFANLDGSPQPSDELLSPNNLIQTLNIIPENMDFSTLSVPSERHIAMITENMKSKNIEKTKEILRIMQKKDKKISNSHKLRKRRKIYLQELATITDHIIDKLVYARTYLPFKVLGIPMTKEIFQSIIAGIGAGIMASLQKLLNS